MDLRKGAGVVDAAGGLFSPLTALFGLPGEVAFAFFAAFLPNLYAAIAILVPLPLPSFQVTRILSMPAWRT